MSNISPHGLGGVGSLCKLKQFTGAPLGGGDKALNDRFRTASTDIRLNRYR